MDVPDEMDRRKFSTAKSMLKLVSAGNMELLSVRTFTCRRQKLLRRRVDEGVGRNLRTRLPVIHAHRDTDAARTHYFGTAWETKHACSPSHSSTTFEVQIWPGRNVATDNGSFSVFVPSFQVSILRKVKFAGPVGYDWRKVSAWLYSHACCSCRSPYGISRVGHRDGEFGRSSRRLLK